MTSRVMGLGVLVATAVHAQVCNGSVPAVTHLAGANFPAGSFPINTWLPVDIVGILLTVVKLS